MCIYVCQSDSIGDSVCVPMYVRVTVYSAWSLDVVFCNYVK